MKKLLVLLLSVMMLMTLVMTSAMAVGTVSNYPKLPNGFPATPWGAIADALVGCMKFSMSNPNQTGKLRSKVRTTWGVSGGSGQYFLILDP